MGRFRSSIPRSRTPWRRRAQVTPAALRYWLFVATLAVVVAAVVGHAVDRAASAERRWGGTRVVFVTTRTVRRGERLDRASRAEHWPTALVSARAVARLPAGAVAAAAVDPGVPLTAALVTGARRAVGTRTVAVSLGDARLPVRAGDLVDVWATADPTEVPDGEPATRQVASDATVVATTGTTVVLAVPPRAVADVADAAATDTVTLVGTA